MVMAGRQPSSSFKILRQIVPEGYTLGWYRGGTNLHLGGYEIVRILYNQTSMRLLQGTVYGYVNVTVRTNNEPWRDTLQGIPYVLCINLQPSQYL